jgi:hypothetical protein
MPTPTVSRSALQRGPGSLTYGGLALLSAEDITASVKLETWRPKISTHGEGAPRVADATAEISFTPTGRITAAIVAALFPAGFRSPVVGARAFPAADVPLLIHGVDGAKHQFANAAPTKMPDLALSPKGTAFGEAMFTALVADNTPPETAGAFWSTPDAEAWSKPFSDSDIIAVPYTGSWGGGPPIHTEEGWKVTFEVGLEPVKVDGVGTVDFEVTNVTVKATCRPVAMTAAQLAAALRPEGLVRGSSLRQGKDLVITGLSGGLTVTLYDAVMTEGPAVWGANASRAGEVTFEASRQLVGSAPSTTLGPVFDIGIVA